MQESEMSLEEQFAAALATGGYFALMGYLQYLGVRRLPA